MLVSIPFGGTRELERKRLFYQQLQAIEDRHLPYFINRPPIFESDAYEYLIWHFFYRYDVNTVSLTQAPSSTLPGEIIAEVVAAFRDIFEATETHSV